MRLDPLLAGRALAAASLAFASCAGPHPTLVTHLHGHNDYLQLHPLRTALQLGLHSVEADVFLVEGELRVGHERWQLRSGRTLTAMYLAPLREHVQQHGGRALADAEPFVLLIDIKADADAVHAQLQRELGPFHAMLTHFVDGRIELGAVTVLLSGARPRAQLEGQRDRWCALDGRPADLDAVPQPPVDLVPWISEAWSRVSDWTGSDELMAEERQRVQQLAARVHAQGRQLRFWGAPDRPEAWQALRELGVDRIGTDRPKVAAAWLRDASVASPR